LGADQTISDETVTAAAEAMEDAAMRWIGRDLGTIHRDDIARDALLAAVPHIEAAIRQAIADEIEAVQHGPGILLGDFAQPAQHFNAGIRAAASVARGGSR
jgi:hypothetical protein